MVRNIYGTQSLVPLYDIKPVVSQTHIPRYIATLAIDTSIVT